MTISRWLATMVVLWTWTCVANAAEPASVDQARATGSRSSDRAAAPEDETADRTNERATQPSATRRGTQADRLDLDTTVVTGNRELPKVLYIVPWKKADLGDLPGQPFNTLLDEALMPVDRDVFRREVTYYGALSDASDGAATPSSGVPKTSGGTEK